MNNNLSISIISYNRPQQLINGIRYLIPQAKKYSIPIYVSDDSTIKTTQNVISKIKYSHLKYIKNKPSLGGAYNSINAIKISQSKYTWLLADDDKVLPGAIKNILELITRLPKLELILVNAKNEHLKNAYFSIKQDIYFDNCKNFFDDFHYKTHLSTPIIHTKYFKRSINEKYYNTMHTFQGIIWEYLSNRYRKNNKNHIYVLKRKLILLGHGQKTWKPEEIRLKYHDRFLWLKMLPDIYQPKAKELFQNLLKYRSHTKRLIEDKISGSLTSQSVKKWFSSFPNSVKIKAKIICLLPNFLNKLILKFMTFKNNFIKFLKNKILCH